MSNTTKANIFYVVFTILLMLAAVAFCAVISSSASPAYPGIEEQCVEVLRPENSTVRNNISPFVVTVALFICIFIVIAILVIIFTHHGNPPSRKLKP
jgi:hypothetical protein